VIDDPLCFELERGIAEHRRFLLDQPRPRALRIRFRPLAKGLADGLITELAGGLLAHPGEGGLAVSSAPVLGHDAHAVCGVICPRMFQGPRGGALGIPVRRRAGHGPEDRALEYRLVALVAQDWLRPAQRGLRAAPAHEFPGHGLDELDPGLQRREFGEEAGEPPLPPRRVRPARHQGVSQRHADSGDIGADLFDHLLRRRGVALRPDLDRRSKRDPPLLPLIREPPRECMLECAQRVEAGPGGEERSQLRRVDQRNHPFVERRHFQQGIGIEAFQQARGSPLALDHVPLAQRRAKRGDQVVGCRRPVRRRRDPADAEGCDSRRSPERDADPPAHCAHTILSRTDIGGNGFSRAISSLRRILRRRESP
jgi:hypothetical protein